MRAMVLAAGSSTRLKGALGGIPKVLFPVQGKTILEHNLSYLRKNGIREIVLNLHYRAGQIKRFLKKQTGAGPKIQFSPEPRLLGTAGGVKKAQRFFGNSPFLVLYGDNLVDFDIPKMLAKHRKTKALVTLGVYNPRFTEWTGIAAGLIETKKNGEVLRFIERRNNTTVPASFWVSAGILICSPKIFSLIPPKSYSDFGKDIFPRLLKEKKKIQTIAGATYVLASDTPETWQRAERIAAKVGLG